jgi:hypothetical protein
LRADGFHGAAAQREIPPEVSMDTRQRASGFASGVQASALIVH